MQQMKSYLIGAAFAVAVLSTPTVQGAQVAIKVGPENNAELLAHPNDYPTSKIGMDFQVGASPQVFTTKNLYLESGSYTVGETSAQWAAAIKLLIHNSEGHKPDGTTWFKVAGITVYREDWLNGTPGGNSPIDWRILKLSDIQAIRDAILAGQNSGYIKSLNIKIIQLLGSGAAPGETDDHAANFPNFSPTVLAQLKNNFEGVGLECHVEDDWRPSRAGVLNAMAAITKWTADNNEKGFIYMGGTAGTYTNFAAFTSTFNSTSNGLFKHMTDRGIDANAPHLIYQRMDIWNGTPSTDQLPESNLSTMFAQMKWLIGRVK